MHVILVTKGSRGDLVPFLAIGAAARRRGHQVSLVTHAPYAGLIHAAGLDAVALDSPEAFARFIADGPLLDTPRGVRDFFLRHEADRVRPEVDVIRACAAGGDGHAVIVARHMSGLAAPLAAELSGIPLVTVFTAVAQATNRALLAAIFAEQLADEANRLRVSCGAAAVSDWSAWMARADATLGSWPSWFQQPQDDLPVGLQAVGFLTHAGSENAPLPDIVEQQLADRATPTPVLITGGTAMWARARTFYEVAAQACAATGRSALLVCPHEALVPSPLPPGVTWHRALPFATLMPRVAAVIHHGGTSVLVRALEAAIPQLTLPYGADRPDTSARLDRLGVSASVLSADWTTGTVARALDALVTSADVKSACAQWASRLALASDDAAEAACVHIERVVERAGGTRRPATTMTTPLPPASPAAAVAALSPARARLLARMLQPRSATAVTTAVPPGITPAVAAAVATPSAQDSSTSTPAAADRHSWPLTLAQRGIWLGAQLDRSGAAYTGVHACLLTGTLRVDALNGAFDAIVERHDILRCTFAENEGEPVAHVHPFVRRPLPVVDLSGLDDDTERERCADRIAKADRQRGFDLNSGPLLRARLLRLAPRRHLLVIAVHHIVFDGASAKIFYDELAAFYASRIQDASSPLPAQYGDHAAASRGPAAMASIDRATEYWNRELAGHSLALDLPTDRPRATADGDARGAWMPLRIPASVTAAIGELARAQRSTTFMVLAAALHALLHRYSGETNVVIGTPMTNRETPEAARLIGLFSQLTALRMPVSPDATFAQLLARTREATLGALAHASVPFEHVARARPGSADGRRASLPVILTLQPAAPAWKMGDVDASILEVESSHARHDLFFFLTDRGDTIDGWVEYRTALFDPATVAAMCAHFVSLLSAAAAAPGAPIETLSFLSADERHALLVDRNDTAAPLHAECVHERIAQQARRSPHALAIDDGREQWDYATLDRRASAVAARLQRMGIDRGMLVAVCLDRRCDLVAALLGIMRAGAAYLPIDPEYPPDRVAFMLQDSGAGLVLTTDTMTARLPANAPRTLLVETVLDGARGGAGSGTDGAADGAHRPVALCADDLAYVIYTSGSTGKPKGVMVTHGSVVNLLDGMQALLRVAPRDRWLAVTTLSFDIAALELLLPLIVGAGIIVASREVAADGAALARLLDSSDATLLQATPVTWRLLLQHGWHARAGLRAICGGEELPATLARELLERGVELFNAYGPTETTIWSAVERVTACDGPVPIGRPLANTQIYIVDPRGEPVPDGVTGELSIGGTGVARGYLNRPALTAERFVPNPFGPAGSRLYRTGDAAAWRRDGTLRFLGRRDRQVKLHGHRLELGEIELVLQTHPAVRQAVTELRPIGGSLRVVSFVVPNHDGVDPRDLIAHAAASLPRPLVPAAIVLLDALPLTPNGKIDRQALVTPALPATTGDEQTRGTELEEIVRQVWCELLERPHVGLHEHFFDLGGHSVTAAQVMARLGKIVGCALHLRMLFDAPTVAGLARAIEQAQGREADAAPIPREEEHGDHPLSFVQERLWFLDQLTGGGAAYIISAPVWLDGTLDVPALTSALTDVVRRHGALRTHFPLVEGHPVQRVEPLDRWHLPLVDVSELSDDARDAAAVQAAHRICARPFVLSDGPLFRAVLVRLAPARHLLALALHHAISDGWSLGVLVDEVTRGYRARVMGDAVERPALLLQYTDIARWQRAQWTPETAAATLGWWRTYLGDEAPVLDLPTDRPRPAIQAFRGGTVTHHLEASTTECINACARRHDATPFMLLLAAWHTLLARLTGQAAIVVGVPVAGRPRVDWEPLIGCFVNTLPVRVTFDGQPTGADLLARVRASCLQAFAHQDVPFGRLVDALQPERHLGHQPICQVMCVFQNTPVPPLDLPDVRVTRQPVSNATAKYDLNLLITPHAGGMQLDLEYDAALFTPATAARRLAEYVHLLEAWIAAPDTPVAQLPLLPLEETETLQRWNAATLQTRSTTAVERIAERTARQPEAIAVVAVDATLTYADVAAQAQRVARRLRARGVRRGDCVAVLLPRRAALVPALLGILQAGAAYVPLDPRWPAARQQTVLRIARCRALLTQAPLDAPADVGNIGDTAVPRFELEALLASGPADGDGDGVATGDATDDATGAAAAGDATPAREVHGLDAAIDGPTPQDLAYVLFTSGSTGTPKGVMVDHAAVSHLLDWLADAYPLGPGDRGLGVAALGFDLSVFDIFGLLAAGATLDLADEELLADPARLAAHLADAPITFWNSAPAALQQLLPLLGPTPSSPLRLVFLSGDWIPRAMPDAITARWPAARVVALGGATEATVWSNHFPLDAPLDETWPSIPYGRAMPHVAYTVRDAHDRLVPIGVPGDLAIAGPCLSWGYLADPARTADAFRPDAHASTPGGRLYRTGDRARWRAEGLLEFLGRQDQQVKLHGIRVELGEIEAALTTHPAVATARVLLHRDPEPARLVAYLVLHPGETAPDADALRAHLRTRLPDYMLPAATIVLTDLPLTPHGKLDLARLPRPDRETVTTTPYVAPRTPREVQLAALWSALLGLARVGVDDNFFALGGDSILTIQLIARAGREGLRLTPRQIFEHQTIALLAAAVADAPQQADMDTDAGEPWLTSIQQWFLDDAVDPAHFNQAIVLEFDAPMDVAALARALTAVMACHDALRLRVRDGAASIASESAWPLHDIDLTALDRHAADAERRRAFARLQASFDLAAGPIARAALVTTRDAALLWLGVHHLAIDAYSWTIVLDDLAEAYAQARAGREPVLSRPSLSWRAWTRRLQAATATSAQAIADDSRSSSTTTAARIDTPSDGRVPLDFANGDNTTNSAQTIVTALSSEDASLLLARGQTDDVRRTDLLLRALGRTLSAWTGREQTLVHVERHGRDLFDDVDVSRTVGWFTNIVPVRVDADAQAARFNETPQSRTREGLLRCAGYDAAARRAWRERHRADIIVNDLGRLDGPAHGATFTLTRVDPGATRSPRAPRAYAIEIELASRDGALDVRWTYSRNLHRSETIQGLAQRFIDEVRTQLRTPHAEPTPTPPMRQTAADFTRVQLTDAQLDALLDDAEAWTGAQS